MSLSKDLANHRTDVFLYSEASSRKCFQCLHPPKKIYPRKKTPYIPQEPKSKSGGSTSLSSPFLKVSQKSLRSVVTCNRKD